MRQPAKVSRARIAKSGLQVVPNCASRSALGEMCDGGLLEIFVRDFGPPGSARFERARHNFLRSEAGSPPLLGLRDAFVPLFPPAV